MFIFKAHMSVLQGVAYLRQDISRTILSTLGLKICIYSDFQGFSMGDYCKKNTLHVCLILDTCVP